jgi:hypothetical protein
MRPITTSALAAIAALIASQLYVTSAGTEPPFAGGGRFQLVGFTNATYDGGETLFGLTLACQAEFAESRFCTSVEVLETVTVPNLAGGDAWVRPVLWGVRTSSHLDQSGVAGTNGALTCSQWSEVRQGWTGLTVNATGTFAAGACEIARPVACCAQVP